MISAFLATSSRICRTERQYKKEDKNFHYTAVIIRGGGCGGGGGGGCGGGRACLPFAKNDFASKNYIRTDSARVVESGFFQFA